MVESRLLGIEPVALESVTGHRHEYEVAVLLAEPPGHFMAVHPGHADVQEDDVRPKVARRRESRVAAMRGAHVVSRDLQQDGQALGGVDVVVHDEYAADGDARHSRSYPGPHILHGRERESGKNCSV